MPLAHFRNIESGNPDLMTFKCEICVKKGNIYTYEIKNKKETHIFCLEHKEEYELKNK